jgi:hypothetical protein
MLIADLEQGWVYLREVGVFLRTTYWRLPYATFSIRDYRRLRVQRHSCASFQSLYFFACGRYQPYLKAGSYLSSDSANIPGFDLKARMFVSQSIPPEQGWGRRILPGPNSGTTGIPLFVTEMDLIRLIRLIRIRVFREHDPGARSEYNALMLQYNPA